jgi:hypothetical protein
MGRETCLFDILFFLQSELRIWTVLYETCTLKTRLFFMSVALWQPVFVIIVHINLFDRCNEKKNQNFFQKLLSYVHAFVNRQ